MGREGLEWTASRLTNGVMVLIRSTIVSRPFGPVMSSSLTFFPMVKLRKRRISMFGLSAS